MLKDAVTVYVFVYVRDIGGARHFYEEQLGLAVLEEDAEAVKYAVGDVILALNRAQDHGIELGDRRDPTLLVFHVDDIDAARAALEARGVSFDDTERYDIGATAACYDPDGHCVTLYEPSAEALTWPSGTRYRELVASAGPAAAGPVPNGIRLSKLAYVFSFVRDAGETAAFYEATLGLPVLERDEGEGVVKYDVGGVILATHPVEGLPQTSSVVTRRSTAVVFHADDIEDAAERLKDSGLPHGGLQRSAIGTTLRFEDPVGNILFLYKPSAEALEWPSGPEVTRIVQIGSRAKRQPA